MSRSAVVGLAVVLVGALARADEPEGNKAAAAQAFRAGQDAFAARQFAVAAEAFEEAHRRIPRAAAIYNAALSWDAAGDEARAADDLWLALEKTDLHGSDADRARSRLTEIETHVATVDVTGAEGMKLSVAHVLHSAPPLHIHLAPGHYPVRVEDDVVRELSLDVGAGEHATLNVPRSQKPPQEPPRIVPPPVVPQVGTDPLRTAGWVSLTVGLAGGAGAVVLGVLTLGAIDDFTSAGSSDAAARDRAVALRTATIATALSASAVGIAAIVMLVVGYERRKTVGVDASGLVLRF